MQNQKCKSDWNIVLDLDATLINTFESVDKIYELVETTDDLNWLSAQSYHFNVTDPDEDGTTKPYYMWGIDRPYLQEFITYLIENFKNIYVYSAGKAKYVECIVDHIFPLLDYNPPIILNFNDIIYDEDTGDVTKPLSKIYEITKGEANEKNTFALDDREDTFKLNKKNGILIPEFSFVDYEEEIADELLKEIKKRTSDDKCLMQLIQFFEKHKGAPDVRELDLTNIFDTNSKSKNDYRDRMRSGMIKLSPSHSIKM